MICLIAQFMRFQYGHYARADSFAHSEKRKWRFSAWFIESICKLHRLEERQSGNLISDWINGRSESYRNYIYEISSKYGVSLEWLKGETDEKNPPVPEDERILNEELISRLVSLTPEEMQKVDAFVQGLLANR